MQTTSSPYEVSSIKGEILLLEDQVTYINITEPLDQKIRLTPNAMLIFYPKESRAFNIKLKSSNIASYQSSIPSLKQIDISALESVGFEKVSQKTEGDTTIYQFVQKNKKKRYKRYPIITLKSFDEKILEASITQSNIERIVINVVEFGEIDSNKTYLKKYELSRYHSSELIEKNIYEFKEVRHANEDDIQRIKFEIPESVEIENKSLY